MAGSYNHCVAADGQLLINEQLQGMLECCLSYCRVCGEPTNHHCCHRCCLNCGVDEMGVAFT